MKNIFIILILLTFLSLISNCNKDSTRVDETKAPEIPPASTFSMDYSYFSLAGSMVTQEAADPPSNTNWLFAAVNVSVWSSLVTLATIIPAAAFVEAFNHDPVLQDDGSWLWSYSFVAQNITYTANLYGALEKLKVTWKMYITKQGYYISFLWYSGESNLTGTTGQWLLNMNPAEPSPFLQIGWNRSADNTTGDLKYTNIIPADDDSSSYIFYAATSDTSYNRQFDLFSVVNSNTTEIRWHSINKNGRVRDPLHYSDNLWHCWGSARNDVECP
jgi:hypothetical protein